MFLTGEFSRIARISKRMLQHYDRIGLFSPEHTDAQTGYRYYSARQLPKLNRILALKDLGLTLDQVKRMIDDNITIEEIHGMLLMQKAELEQQLRESLERIQGVEVRLERLLDAPTQKRPEVVVKSVPAVSYIATRQVIPDFQTGQAMIEQILTGLPARVGKNTLGHLMSVMHSPAFELENNDSEIGFVLNGTVDDPIVLAEDMVLTVRELAPVETMATVVQIGKMDMLPAGYAAIAEWMEVHSYRQIASQREIYLEMPASGNPDELVTEIQFPVEKLAPDLTLLTSNS